MQSINKTIALVKTIIVLSILVLGFTVSVPVAEAGLVHASTGGFGVDVYTGSKNYSNRTQWVDTIEVYLGSGNKVEAWGDGFYRSASGKRARWYIGRWVRSGTYVCGATNITGSSQRKIACISIRV